MGRANLDSIGVAIYFAAILVVRPCVLAQEMDVFAVFAETLIFLFVDPFLNLLEADGVFDDEVVVRPLLLGEEFLEGEGKAFHQRLALIILFARNCFLQVIKAGVVAFKNFLEGCPLRF